eukprot:SAG31_NODE_1677_length_7533_cov_2.288054_3_plen_122_part_00
MPAAGRQHDDSHDGAAPTVGSSRHDDDCEATAAEDNQVHRELAKRYGFLVGSFRPACFFWEPVDLFRKLALTSLLQFFERGTAMQVRVQTATTLRALHIANTFAVAPHLRRAASFPTFLLH